MKIQRIDHIGINVNDLDVAKAFFLDLGFEVIDEWEMHGKLLETVVALPGAKTSAVMVGLPGSPIKSITHRLMKETYNGRLQTPWEFGILLLWLTILMRLLQN